MYKLNSNPVPSLLHSAVSMAAVLGALSTTDAQAASLQGFLPTVQGTASTWAAGMSFQYDSDTPSLENDLIRVKSPLGQTSFPQELDPLVFTTSPNFTLPAMFPNLDARGLLSDLHIDAMSTDNPMPDVLPNGRMQIGNLWAALMFSVTPETTGEGGSIINTRSMNQNFEHGSDIYGHYVQQSQGIVGSLKGETILEIGAPKIRANEAGERRNMDGLDFAIGVLSHRQGTPTYVIWGSTAVFYFSVSNESATALNLMGGLIPGNTNTNGASIYKITWSNGQWSPIVEDVVASKMGLKNAGDDIDALAVSSGRGVYVFSTVLQTPSDARFQVYKKSWGTVVDSPKLKDAAGTPLEESIGLDHDNNSDPDAVCIVDPEAIPGKYDDFVGTALTPLLAPSGPTQNWLGLSTCLSGGVGTPDPKRLHLEVTGLGSGSPIWVGVSTNYPQPAPASAHWDFGPFGTLPPGVSDYELTLDLSVFTVFSGVNLSVYFMGFNDQAQICTTWISGISTQR